MEEHQKEEHGYICSVCQHKCAEWSSLKDHTLMEHGGYLTSESNAGLSVFLNERFRNFVENILASAIYNFLGIRSVWFKGLDSLLF